MLSLPARRWLLLLYLIIISILFVLPGKAFPKAGWLDQVYFDKWVHFGIFGLAAVLWQWCGNTRWKGLMILVIYGLAVELVQHAWVANRSFDLYDWLADIAGTVTGMWFAGQFLKDGVAGYTKK